MSDLSALTTKKEELLAQIRRIEESCEGIENEANARKVSELNEQQMSLSARKRELQAKLSALDVELNGIGSKINELSGTGVDRILEAIRNQRWFWFAGHPKILFDRDTALLWADLNYFPYNNCDVNRINDHLDDYNGQWQIPTYLELWKLVADHSFPFRGGSNWRIKDAPYWTVVYNGNYCYKNLDGNGAASSIYNGTRYNIPCCRALVPPDYVNNISPSNNFYTAKEKLQFTLDIFTSNELVPLFADESVTHLYRSIYVEKPALLKQLADVQSEINKLQEVVLLSSTFDYHALLTPYNIPAIDRSILKYHEAVTSLADDFLRKFRDFEDAKRSVLSEFAAAQSRLDALPPLDEFDLDADDKNLLDARRKTFARRLVLDLDAVKDQIISVKKQGETLAERIDAANRGGNSLVELGAIAAEPRAEFSLVAENLACIVRNALKRIEFIEQNLGFIFSLLDALRIWDEAFINFRTEQIEKFFEEAASHNLIDNADDWSDAWIEKRRMLERAFGALADYALRGNLLEHTKNEPAPATQALKLLQTYKDDTDKYYLETLWAAGDDADRNEKARLVDEQFKKGWEEFTSSIKDVGDRLFLDGLMK